MAWQPALSALSPGDITPGSGDHTLVGDNLDNTWTILDVAGVPDSGSVVSLGGTTNFAGVENLTGNALIDDFNFADNATLSGALRGAGGAADNINFGLQTGAVDVTVGLVGGGIVNGGIFDIESVTGNGAQSTLKGSETTNTWTLLTPNDGNFVGGTNDLDFFNFNNLVGGGSSTPSTSTQR